ncbi:response regulator [candidate division KSB1 bacterium]|nr:response regulator [candidate division KSB1 bacterium]NIR69800.1 response regulator [candidate division KSB1 bacterium]NIS25790.1 response regulator [candidate division KSB1 bacterium]NIT72664.1 response regulator [candidate division KSB1 bacterium]NIU26479.1 response regulator [candidate division KSB1 bacterium]
MSNDGEQTDRARVLILDDEEMVLTSLSSFLELETDYEVVTFKKGSEALEYVKENRVDLVISDYLMPDMDGITFLGKVKEIDPHSTRIILTGYADKENAIKAINDVGLFQYIEKPWDNEDLKIVLRNGLEKRRLMQELDKKVEEIKKAYGDLQGLHREILKAFA